MANLDDLRIDDSQEKAHASRHLWRMMVWALLLVGLTGGGGVLWWMSQPEAGDENDTNTEASITQPTAAPEPDRRTAGSNATPANGRFTAGGYVEIAPPGPLIITTQVTGWVRSLEVIEGDKVEAGDILVVLDDVKHRQALAEAETEQAWAQAKLDQLRAGFREEEIADAEARFHEAQARVDFAMAEVERYEALEEIGASTSGQLRTRRVELAEAESTLQRAQAFRNLRNAGQRPVDIAVAEAALRQAETRLEHRRWELEQTVLRSPVAAVVLELYVRMGDWVAPGPERARMEGAGGGAIVALFDPQRLQVWVEVNQRDAARVQEGDPVRLRADALSDQEFHGRVARIMPKANLQRNTLEVKIELVDANGNPYVPSTLRPEMSVQVTFLPEAAQSLQDQQRNG